MYSFLKKFLFVLEPEMAHALVKRSDPFIPKIVLSRLTRSEAETLKGQIGSTPLKSPIGLAAGFDKNGELLDLMGSLGFGFLEIGSVTARACMGNPRPRVFRLPKDKSIINRMGLPNWGADKVGYQLSKNKKNKIPIGINIAKTPESALGNSKNKLSGIDDIIYSISKLNHLGTYMAINLSCPNTTDGRTFQDPAQFEELAKSILQVRLDNKMDPPFLIKLSPNLEVGVLNKIIDKALKYNFDGFIVSNTTPEIEGLKTEQSKVALIGSGGLSGRALTISANRQLKKVFDIVGPNKILMGVGGILNFEDLLNKIALGANYFQVYTGLIYEGPFFIYHLNKKLDSLCRRIGVKNYRELVGSGEILKLGDCHPRPGSVIPAKAGIQSGVNSSGDPEPFGKTGSPPSRG